jgi:hypothetical protein
MLIEMRDDMQLAIKPENTAEMAYLRSFVGGTIEVENPPPFTMNVEVLLIKKKVEDAPHVDPGVSKTD